MTYIWLSGLSALLLAALALHPGLRRDAWKVRALAAVALLVVLGSLWVLRPREDVEATRAKTRWRMACYDWADAYYKGAAAPPELWNAPDDATIEPVEAVRQLRHAWSTLNDISYACSVGRVDRSDEMDSKLMRLRSTASTWGEARRLIAEIKEIVRATVPPPSPR